MQIGADWPTGVYFAQLTADDGRLGFAPLVIRPPAPSQRVAVVLPTTTWQAYNFYDADGDGWGDTWYSHWKTAIVDLTRPHPNRGIPYRYRSYDLRSSTGSPRPASTSTCTPTRISSPSRSAARCARPTT